MKIIHPNYTKKISTSRKELWDLSKAWAGITLAFALVLRTTEMSLFTSILVAAVSVGLGFLFHELAHKILAQRYGCFAEFRSSDMMLLLAVFMAGALGVVIAAPGAVVISGHLTKNQNGKISIAGPTTNIVLAIIFLIGFLSTGWIVAKYGAMINAVLAFFNLLPLSIMDVKKVLAWNKQAYIAALTISIILFFVTSII